MRCRNRLLVFAVFGVFVFITHAFSQTTQQLFAEAVKNAQKGNHEAAIKFFQQIVDMHPNFAPAYNFLGLSYQETGLDLTEVAWYFRAAVDIDPHYEDALINLGKTYYELGRFDLAEKNFLQALSVNPRSLDAHLSLGWVYLVGKTDPSKAISSFRSVLEQIEHPAAYFGLGMAYFMNAETPRALECITALRVMKHDELAQQLESAIRDKEYALEASQERSSLGSASHRDSQLMPQESRIAVVPMEAQITVTGTMPVRLKGKFNFNAQEVGKDSSATTPASEVFQTHQPKQILTSD